MEGFTLTGYCLKKQDKLFILEDVIARMARRTPESGQHWTRGQQCGPPATGQAMESDRTGGGRGDPQWNLESMERSRRALGATYP